MAADHTTSAVPTSDSVSALVTRATEQISTLVRDELALAKTELVGKAKRAGIGGGLFGTAGILAVYGLGLLIALAVVGLNLVWPLWLAVLAIAVAVFATAGLSALIGKRQLARAAPLLPAEAQASIAADITTMKSAVQEGRAS